MASNSDTHHIPPWELQVGHLDALIIYAEDSPDDKIKACELRDAINGFSFNNGIMGKAALYDETLQFGQSLVTSLDDALQFSTLLFVLYSKNLENDQVYWHTTNASLWLTIENRARSDMFIPVIWRNGNVSTAYAREKKELDMSKGDWKNQLKRLINRHLEKRLDREKEQEEHLLSYQATNRAPPNDYTLLYARMPSQNQDGLGNMDCQRSLENIDVHGNALHPHDADHANGNGALQFPWNCMKFLLSEKRLLYILGFAIASFTVIKLRAR